MIPSTKVNNSLVTENYNESLHDLQVLEQFTANSKDSYLCLGRDGHFWTQSNRNVGLMTQFCNWICRLFCDSTFFDSESVRNTNIANGIKNKLEFVVNLGKKASQEKTELYKNVASFKQMIDSTFMEIRNLPTLFQEAIKALGVANEAWKNIPPPPVEMSVLVPKVSTAPVDADKTSKVAEATLVVEKPSVAQTTPVQEQPSDLVQAYLAMANAPVQEKPSEPVQENRAALLNSFKVSLESARTILLENIYKDAFAILLKQADGLIATLTANPETLVQLEGILKAAIDKYSVLQGKDQELAADFLLKIYEHTNQEMAKNPNDLTLKKKAFSLYTFFEKQCNEALNFERASGQTLNEKIYNLSKDLKLSKSILREILINPPKVFVDVPPVQIPVSIGQPSSAIKMPQASPILSKLEMPQEPVVHPKIKISFKEASTLTTTLLMTQKAKAVPLIQSKLAKLIQELPQKKDDTMDNLKGMLDGTMNFYLNTNTEGQQLAIQITNAIVASILKKDEGMIILNGLISEVENKVKEDPNLKTSMLEFFALFRSSLANDIEIPSVLALDQKIVKVMAVLRPQPVVTNTITPTPNNSVKKQAPVVVKKSVKNQLGAGLKAFVSKFKASIA